MRFVSNSPGLGLGTAIPERFVLALNGDRDLQADPETGWVGSVPISFSQTGLTSADIKFALEYWPEKTFTGRWLDADGVTQQPIAERIGVFDTDDEQAARGWPDELKAKVERWLLAKPNYGQDFVQVVKVPVAKPWPSYDTTHHNKIPVLAGELGNIDDALAYERENKNRQSVIDALEAAKAKPADSVEGDLIAA